MALGTYHTCINLSWLLVPTTPVSTCRGSRYPPHLYQPVVALGTYHTCLNLSWLLVPTTPVSTCRGSWYPPHLYRPLVALGVSAPVPTTPVFTSRESRCNCSCTRHTCLNLSWLSVNFRGTHHTFLTSCDLGLITYGLWVLSPKDFGSYHLRTLGPITKGLWVLSPKDFGSYHRRTLSLNTEGL